jgi:spermidine synthase
LKLTKQIKQVESITHCEIERALIGWCRNENYL